MQFTKNKGMFFASVFIVFVVYNVLVFVIPFSRGDGFWVGYGFSMVAMALTATVCFYVFRHEGLRSKVYGVPLIFVAWYYFVIQLIIGLLEMFSSVVPFQYGIAVNTVLLGACLIGLIVVDVSKDEIECIDEKVKEKVFYIKSLQIDVVGLVDKASDESMKNVLKELAETIRYSDPMSSPQVVAIENKIEAKVAVLAETVTKADTDAVKALCNELQQLFAERNRKCKALK